MLHSLRQSLTMRIGAENARKSRSGPIPVPLHFACLLIFTVAWLKQRHALGRALTASSKTPLRTRFDAHSSPCAFVIARRREKDKLFVFVTRRDVPPTNNISERRLRSSVIFRKVTNGFRSAWGAQIYAAICSVIETGMLRGLSAFAAIRARLAGSSVLAAQ